jgi:hypothetical protein
VSEGASPQDGEEASGYFEHGADIGVIGRGATVEEAFEQAAAAMFGVMIDRDTANPTTSVDVAFEEDDLELALVRWLNGLLAAARVEKLALFRPSRPVYLGPWFAHNAFISWVEATPAKLNLTGDPNMSGFSSPFPTVVDIATGVIAPIEPQFFMDNYGPGNRKFPLAYLPGPFARVITPGDCLNVRTEPTTTSQSLGCFRDGVLLRIGSGDEVTSGSTTWMPVQTPDGHAGYASSEFVER